MTGETPGDEAGYTADDVESARGAAREARVSLHRLWTALSPGGESEPVLRDLLAAEPAAVAALTVAVPGVLCALAAVEQRLTRWAAAARDAPGGGQGAVAPPETGSGAENLVPPDACPGCGAAVAGVDPETGRTAVYDCGSWLTASRPEQPELPLNASPACLAHQRAAGHTQTPE